MKNVFIRILTTLVLISSSIIVSAQTIVKPEPTPTLSYSVKPDYRKCAFPMCGGWFLTPLNQYSLQLQDENEIYQNASLVPNSVYVAYINYKALGLKPAQVQELESAMRSEQAILRGAISNTPNTSKLPASKTLNVNAAWVGANKTLAVGPYLNISSSGIVCITTPCPYYKANVINTSYSRNFDELTFSKAELTQEQEAQAWQAIASKGLVMTGVKYESQGQVGTGIGISASKVFFAFPAKY